MTVLKAETDRVFAGSDGVHGHNERPIVEGAQDAIVQVAEEARMPEHPFRLATRTSNEGVEEQIRFVSF